MAVTEKPDKILTVGKVSKSTTVEDEARYERNFATLVSPPSEPPTLKIGEIWRITTSIFRHGKRTAEGSAAAEDQNSLQP